MAHLATGNPINSCLTPNMDKTHHGPVIALFFRINFKISCKVSLATLVCSKETVFFYF